jgi:nucleoside-diphosphate-sugar epimerase
VKVLVTGSNGFIGKALKKELAFRGHVAAAYDVSAGYDVTNRGQLNNVILGFGADAIINLAGMLGTPELFGNEYQAAQVNILGALNVYDLAAKFRIPVVQIGTGHKGQPNPYAITKGCAEDLGLARAQWSAEKISVVRAYHVYGPGQAVGPPHGTASVHKFFPTFAVRALTDMPLELCGGGDQIIDPIYVDDVAKILVDAIAGPYGEVTEAGNGWPVSVEEVAADILFRVPESRSHTTGVAARDGEPANAEVVGSVMRANQWPYKVQETVEWYRQWLLSSR